MSLPAVDTVSAAHSARTSAYIRERIREAGGVISFAEFMQHALYAPGLGYYVSGATKFGAAGDFVTAPEVSPIFARIVARQCAEVMGQLDAPGILELGAGSGRLAVELLRALAEHDALPEKYRIFEISADLRERQERTVREQLGGLAERVEWCDRLPESHCGVVIANEVLDALPVERFRKSKASTLQVCVAEQGGEFRFVARPAPDRLDQAVADIETDLNAALPDGYLSDVSLSASGWVEDIAALLERGLILLFDYGVSRHHYYAADRSSGWLRCHFRHHAHNDPLILAGIQDITAWVDFSAVAAAAVECGLEIGAYVTQAHFLMHGGLERELAAASERTLEEQIELSRQVKLLTLPGEMGEHFKCLALLRGNLALPTSLKTADRAHTL